jgi:hypothetical protein
MVVFAGTRVEPGAYQYFISAGSGDIDAAMGDGDAPAGAGLVRGALAPGDVLYLPKGTWHRAQAIGGSLGLTLAMESVTPLHLIQSVLAPYLAKVASRDQLPGFRGGLGEEELSAELEGVFHAALEEIRGILHSMTAADLYAAWRQMLGARPRAR